jgi:branched-chain amino acid transport system ATP-binding protein
MAEPLLRTEGLSKHFGGVRAVEDVHLEVGTGRLHAIIGPNGAGKTTLFHLLTGVHPPSAGRIEFRGEDVTPLSTWRRVERGIARSYQRTNVFRRLTVRQNLMVPAQRSQGLRWSLFAGRTARTERAERLIEEVLELLLLRPFADAETQTLPYGAQRLVDVGIALCCQPTLLLLDEPTSGLSAGELSQAVQVLQRLRERYTILLIEHNMELVLGVADRITVLDFGRVIAEGTSEEVARDPAVQRAYFGSRHVSRH